MNTNRRIAGIFHTPRSQNSLRVVGTARCAVPARVVAGGTNIRATLAFEEVAPLHAARTSQRDVPTTLNTYGGEGRGGRAFPLISFSEYWFGLRLCRLFSTRAGGVLSPGRRSHEQSAEQHPTSNIQHRTG